MKRIFLVFAVVMLLTTAATMTLAATLAEWDFSQASYTPDTVPLGHWTYAATAGSLTTAKTDVRFAPTVGTPSSTVANWEQVQGVTSAADDLSVQWVGNSGTHSVNTGVAGEGWFTAARQTLTISANIRYNQMRFGNDQNQMFTLQFGQSGNTSQILFNANAAIFTSRYASGGTNPGGVGSPYTTVGSDSLNNYIAYGTVGPNAAVAATTSSLGVRENDIPDWRGFAGVSVMKNDSSSYRFMSSFAERGSVGTAEPFIAADPNAISIAAAGADGVLGNTDDWIKYTMSIDFSAGTYAVYKVYVGNVLQTTLTQNLPTGKLASDYWTVREFRIGASNYFSGAIDNLKVTDTIDNPAVPEPATLVGLLAFAPALIAVSRRRK